MKTKVIIYAGVKSPTWDLEALKLQHVLEQEGYKVIKTIPINGLAHPVVEYLKP